MIGSSSTRSLLIVSSPFTDMAASWNERFCASGSTRGLIRYPEHPSLCGPLRRQSRLKHAEPLSERGKSREMASPAPRWKSATRGRFCEHERCSVVLSAQRLRRIFSARAAGLFSLRRTIFPDFARAFRAAYDLIYGVAPEAWFSHRIRPRARNTDHLVHNLQFCASRSPAVT